MCGGGLAPQQCSPQLARRLTRRMSGRGKAPRCLHLQIPGGAAEHSGQRGSTSPSAHPKARRLEPRRARFTAGPAAWTWERVREGVAVRARQTVPCSCRFLLPGGGLTDSHDSVKTLAIQGQSMLAWTPHWPSPSGNALK